jgi:alkyl hydroperoxide reductase subunit AhpF
MLLVSVQTPCSAMRGVRVGLKAERFIGQPMPGNRAAGYLHVYCTEALKLGQAIA